MLPRPYRAATMRADHQRGAGARSSEAFGVSQHSTRASIPKASLHPPCRGAGQPATPRDQAAGRLAQHQLQARRVRTHARPVLPVQPRQAASPSSSSAVGGARRSHHEIWYAAHLGECSSGPLCAADCTRRADQDVSMPPPRCGYATAATPDARCPCRLCYGRRHAYCGLQLTARHALACCDAGPVWSCYGRHTGCPGRLLYGPHRARGGATTPGPASQSN